MARSVRPSCALPRCSRRRASSARAPARIPASPQAAGAARRPPRTATRSPLPSGSPLAFSWCPAWPEGRAWHCERRGRRHTPCHPVGPPAHRDPTLCPLLCLELDTHIHARVCEKAQKCCQWAAEPSLSVGRPWSGLATRHRNLHVGVKLGGLAGRSVGWFYRHLPPA